MANYQIRVTPKQSKELQELVLQCNGAWTSGDLRVMHEDKPYIIILWDEETDEIEMRYGYHGFEGFKELTFREMKAMLVYDYKRYRTTDFKVKCSTYEEWRKLQTLAIRNGYQNKGNIVVVSDISTFDSGVYNMIFVTVPDTNPKKITRFYSTVKDDKFASFEMQEVTYKQALVML